MKLRNKIVIHWISVHYYVCKVSAWKLSEWFSQKEIIRTRLWEFIFVARFLFAYWWLYGKLKELFCINLHLHMLDVPTPPQPPASLFVGAISLQSNRALASLKFRDNFSPPLYRPLPSCEEIWGKSNTLALSFIYPYHIQTLCPLIWTSASASRYSWINIRLYI